MKVHWQSWFRGEKERAARLVRDPIAVLRATDIAGAKAHGARGPLARLWDDLHVAIRLVRAWARRDYRGVARSTIVLVVGALLYFVSPIDAICDAVPVLGLVDDAAVLSWVFAQVRWELELFREWESRPAPELPAVDAAA